MAEELFTDLLKNFGKNLKKAKEEGKLQGGYRFADDGKIKLGGGYYGEDKMLQVEIGKDGGNILFKKRFADGGTATAKRGLVDGPGSYAGLTLEQALSKILKTQTTFKNREELLTKIKGLGLKNTSIETLTPGRFPILRTVIYTETPKKITDQMLEDSLGKEKLDKLKKEGLSRKQLNKKYSDKKTHANLSKEQIKKRNEKNRLRNQNLNEKIALDRKEKAMIRRQPKKGYSFYKVNKAENLLWNDLLRTAKNKNGYFTFKGEAPVIGKYYNKVDTEKFVLVDKKGNEFKYSTLSDDIKKHSGQKLDDVLRPYKQKEYLSAQKITQELNKLYGYKPGAPKSVFHTQHIEGIDKNPFKVHLTFGNQNSKEAGSRKSFNADWKTANDLSLGDGERFKAQRAAVNRYYKSLGPDIVAQIGKQPKGTAPALTELLTRLKDTKGNTITSPIIQEAINNLKKPENAKLNSFVKEIENQIRTVKRYTNKNGIKLDSFAGVVDLSKSGLKMPPAIKNALNTIVKYGGKTLRGVGKGAIVLDPIFAAYDFSTAIDQGAGGKNSSEYMVKRLGEGFLNLPDLVASGGKFVKDKLQGKDAKFEQGTLYKPFDFAQRGLEENLAAMPQSQKVRNIAERDFDVGIGASMGMVDDDQVPASRQETEKARQKFLKSQMGPYYKYGIESLEEKKPKKLNLQNNGIFSIRSNNQYNT